MKLHLLQVCNVGQIVGGTGACTLTVVKSLPEFEHTVACLGRISQEMREVFQGVTLLEWSSVSRENIEKVQPDLILFHNTSQRRVEGKPEQVSIQYVHSRITPADADRFMYCSRWLANQCGGDQDQVCYQAVFKPRIPKGISEETFFQRKEEEWKLRQKYSEDESVIRVGRICTPRKNKWPGSLVAWYRDLAKRFPRIRWEFVGCPDEMQKRLKDSCEGRAAFAPASWGARVLLREWDLMLYHHPDVTESFGRIASEAMRAGCIPVVDRRGGFCEQLVPGKGYLCERRDDFISALDELMDDSLRIKMSRRCRIHADEKFSLRRFGDDLLNQFQAACCESS